MSRRAVAAMSAGVMAAMLTGCSLEMKPFRCFISTGEYGWNRADTLRYYVSPPLAPREADEMLEIRATNDYPYRNLGIVVKTEIYSESTPNSQPKAPNSKLKVQSSKLKTAHFIDTLTIDMTPKRGFDDTDRGIMLRNKAVRVRSLSLNDGDSLIIKVHHIMEDEQLEGIGDVGIKLETLL